MSRCTQCRLRCNADSNSVVVGCDPGRFSPPYFTAVYTVGKVVAGVREDDLVWPIHVVVKNEFAFVGDLDEFIFDE